MNEEPLDIKVMFQVAEHMWRGIVKASSQDGETRSGYVRNLIRADLKRRGLMKVSDEAIDMDRYE
jgi:hypothetical protein